MQLPEIFLLLFSQQYDLSIHLRGCVCLWKHDKPVKRKMFSIDSPDRYADACCVHVSWLAVYAVLPWKLEQARLRSVMVRLEDSS